MDGAAVVIRCARERVEVNDHELGARQGYVAGRREPAHTIVRCRPPGTGHGVVDVHEAIGIELRIERDTDGAAFAGAVHSQRHERRRQQHAGFDDANRAALFRDEHAAVRR